MKIKKLCIFLSIVFIANSTFANITAQSLSLRSDDLCAKIEGQWAGRGLVKTYIGPIHITCRYSGAGELISTDSADSFVMNILLRAESGICPSNLQLSFPGTCHDGVVELKTERANLAGTINPDGKSVDMSGTVNLPVMGRDVTATVEDLHLQKQ